MILRYYGHAFFSLSLENGTEIAFDPYGDFYDFPKRNVHADLCLISHHHHDHDGMNCIQPGAKIIDQPGRYRPAEGVSVTGISTWHDDKKGALRGSNTFFVVESEGLRIGHAGDLGHVPEKEQLAAIGKLDVLLIPVGGYYTIDGPTALEVCRLIQPTIAVPMHYRTSYDEEMPVANLQSFLNLTNAADSQMPLVRLTKADMSQREPVITLAIC